jgi:hypothetical protein
VKMTIFRSTLLLWVTILWLLTLCTIISTAQECTSDGVCDQHERCEVWRAEGECLRNTVYMKKHCPVACRNEVIRQLASNECSDVHGRCPVWAELGECDANPQVMMKYCAKSCGGCDGDVKKATEVEDIDDDDDDLDDDVDDGDDDEESGDCAKSCKTCTRARPKTRQAISDEALKDQTVAFGERQTAEGTEEKPTLDTIYQSVQYMNSDTIESLPNHLLANCKNRHALCSFWATLGEVSLQ